MIENLAVIGTGFAVVMSVLVAIWAACAGVGTFFNREKKESKPTEASPAPPRAAVASRAGVPPHHLAAITAAVADVFGPGYVVTRVAAPSHVVTDWPIEGRKDTFQGRRIRTAWGPTRLTLGGETPNILRGQNK
ncbi:oxaloacetate decarboxylase gamma subunit [Aliiruegeria haliotis]|uniref:Oxaloacetate decarboxylase gamma subunit n=1 Tax=Aliiruegeria haliotis TaxID=1280846 RepID=A0A2T0RY51_9RHOB|nr:OadG family protein [Aliiruegeria haliotis]PRY26116.1 oxaloacetate decarboxylase gamma subunit [Aliiruegeria haliotis]